MECLAHYACKISLGKEPSSLNGVKEAISVNPEQYESTTDLPINPTGTLYRVSKCHRPPHVGVIGAGMAGLRCGRRLSEGGCKVTVLEARDRVGGRVHQIEQSGTLIDMGPNWIHGSKGNPILILAHELKDVCYEPPDGMNTKSPVYDSTGSQIDPDVAMEHSAIAWDIVDEAIRYSRANLGANIPPEKSLMDYFEEAIRVRGYDEEKTRLILGLADMWSNIVGEPIQMQSLRYMWLEECIEGENWFLASTYKAILDKVHQECMEYADLLLKKKVTRIMSLRNHDADSEPMAVTTEDGTTYRFDEIVVTAPLGWLKRNTSVFLPPLPPRVLRSIEHVGYGRLEKVYIQFAHAFWQSEDAANGEPFIFQFLNPNYAPEHNSMGWTIECVSLATLPPRCKHATLLFYINGPISEYVTSLVRGCEPGSKEHYQKLKAFFWPYYSRLPNYKAESCEPVAICSTDWQNDELAGNGSYSTYQVSDSAKGLIELDKDIETLRIGLPERHLWFAGEHTAPTLALGTTTGAYWSGEAVADRLLGVYGLRRSQQIASNCS